MNALSYCKEGQTKPKPETKQTRIDNNNSQTKEAKFTSGTEGNEQIEKIEWIRWLERKKRDIPFALLLAIARSPIEKLRPFSLETLSLFLRPAEPTPSRFSLFSPYLNIYRGSGTNQSRHCWFIYLFIYYFQSLNNLLNSIKIKCEKGSWEILIWLIIYL